MVSRQIRVKGRVQGVGYRYAFSDEAQRLGLRGWVRNRADGSVEALVQGAQEAVERMLAWARRGPRLAAVSEMLAAAPEAQFDRTYEAFEIWPSA
jgi:acylphosphatase